MDLFGRATVALLARAVTCCKTGVRAQHFVLHLHLVGREEEGASLLEEGGGHILRVRMQESPSLESAASCGLSHGVYLRSKRLAPERSSVQY